MFTAPAEESVLAPSAAEAEPFPDYPPWDLDPAYAAASASAVTSAWDLESSDIPNGPATVPMLASPAATEQDLGLSTSASSVQRSQQGRHRRH